MPEVAPAPCVVAEAASWVGAACGQAAEAACGRAGAAPWQPEAAALAELRTHHRCLDN